MNKNEIITDIYNQHIVERAISSSGFAIKDTIYDDIVQELYLYICQLDENKIYKLYNENKLLSYICCIVHNQLFNKYSKINKKYIEYELNRCELDENNKENNEMNYE